MRSLTSSIVAAPATEDRAWLPGLPHVLVACLIAPVLGISACITGLLIATLASFVVYLPLTVLALNHGNPLAEDAPAPELSRRSQIVLLVLWTATAWAAAWIVSLG